MGSGQGYGTGTVPRTVVGESLLHAGPDPARRIGVLRALALRSRHDLAVDALATWAGSSVPAAVLARRLAAGEPVPAEMLERPRVSTTLALATALVAMQRREEELQAGVELFAAVLAGHGPRALSDKEQRHLVQAAFLAGRYTMVEEALQVLNRLTDPVRSGLQADLANPVVGGPGAMPHTRWEQLFGSRFVTRELVPPQVDPDEGCLFDGLRLLPSRSVDGPLVTVVIPAFRPEEGLITSVRSIVDQSHGNLEILLVDDCSGPEYAELFDRAEAMDDRVRLIRQERNGGSYLGRNTALAQARGKLVTTQDADDWSHPERIARQVELMTERPESIASRSGAIRCRPDLTRQWFGYSPERMNASALMVRTEVLQGLGGFDMIRKGADSEMHERLLLLGKGRVVDVAAPLAVTRLAEGSLSRADFSFGRHSPDRVLYRSSFRRWHDHLARTDAEQTEETDQTDETWRGEQAGQSGQIKKAGQGGMAEPTGEARQGGRVEPAGPARQSTRNSTAPGPISPDRLARFAAHRQGQQPFPVPRSFVRDLPHAAATPVDYPLVLMVDVAQPFPEVIGRPDLAQYRQWAQGPVGVLGRENLTRAGEQILDWHPMLLDAAREGQADLLVDGDRVHARTLVVLEPDLLALPALPLPAVTADRVLMVAVPPGPAEPVRDLDTAAATVRDQWGYSPQWVARDPEEQHQWAHEGWSLPLLSDLLRQETP